MAVVKLRKIGMPAAESVWAWKRAEVFGVPRGRWDPRSISSDRTADMDIGR